uniref:Interleukin-5 n=1 Tax=Malurus cyaneus samueli TaxID=2593467 RepID=A0A8C5U2N3_9PASS
MKTHLYLLLLAACISAAPQIRSMAELLTLLQQMCEMMTKDVQVNSISIFLNLRIETPDDIDDANCISAIFEGTEQLKNYPAMKKFSAFFQKFERLKEWVMPSFAKEVGIYSLTEIMQQRCNKIRTIIHKRE